ncbi:MAG: RNA polymerase sigma factor [Clostridia bacterium]|nr:RNA polymerase sigma factor [Clostridia bacterium]
MTESDAYFEAVYDRTYTELLRYVVIKTNRADGVEDILQTVYQRFYLRIRRKGYADIEQPKAFLIDLAKKELWRQKRRRETQAVEIARAAELPDPAALDVLAENRLLAREVWSVVQSEPLLSYKCFVLYYGFDMPVCAIAEKLSIGEEAVKSRLFRTRGRVRARFFGKEEETS